MTSKTRLSVVLTAVVALLLSAAACSADATLVEVSYGDFIEVQNATHEVSVPSGTTIDVALYSNRTTGFEWEEPEISDTAVLEQTGRQFVGLYNESTSDPTMPGRDVFALETTGEGQSTVTFHYSRPWEGGQRDVWTFTLVVNVE